MLAALAPCGLAGTLVGKPSQLTSPDQVPEGLAKSDWQSIRDAYDAGRHAFQPVGDGWQARNPGQQWLTQFDGQGFTVTPDAGGWTWGLELAGYGKPTKEWLEGKKISYARADGLTEWFFNDKRGLEQGWTLTQRPERAGPSGPVRLDLTVRGGLRPQVSPEGASVAFLNESGGAALTYGGLKAWDADGKTVQARFVEGEGISDSLGVVVDDTEAKYPITVDPIAQQAYLKASNTGADDLFGESVTVSGDTVVIGANGEDSNATGVNGNQADNSAPDSGAAYVFVRSGTTWTQQAYLKASNTGAGDNFGISVAVSGDTVVVGAAPEASNATGVNGDQANNSAWGSGAAYVFVRSGTTWTQQAYLKASNTGADDSFGTSVAVSGNTVVVGARSESSNATGVNGNQADNSALYSGAAYVFVRSGTTWTQQAYLKASNTGAGDQFGRSVAISGDTVVVGAFVEASSEIGVNGDEANNLALGSGAAYVFVRSGITWTQQAYLKASNTGAYDLFGTSVAVSGDTVVVGAYGEDSNATGVNGDQANNSAPGSGAAYVFVRSETTWSQQAYLKSSNTGDEDNFGISVAVSGDSVVAGARLEDSSGTGANGNQADNSAPNSGAAYVFVRSGTTWTQQAYLKASNTGTDDLFGTSVAVSGNTVVVGARGEPSNATGVNGNQADNSVQISGAAYLYSLVSYSLLSTGANGTVAGAGDYAPGIIATLTASAAPGYLFTGWTGDASGTTNPLSVLMDSDKTIGATFTRQYTLSTPTPTNGAITGMASDGKYLTGTTAALTAVPATGYVFTGWTGAASGTVNPLPVLMDSDKTIGATFAREYTLTPITPSNGTITGLAPSGKYPTGMSATLTAVPNSGFAFTGWTGDASGEVNPLSVLMNTDKTIGATFTRQFSLTTTTLINGTITGLVSGGKYLTGTTATLTAVPAPGYAFTGWTGSASGTTNPLSVLMDSDKTIGATFIRQYTLITTAPTNGTITGLAADGKYFVGTTANLTAVPAPGYTFTGWTGSASGTTNPLSALMDSDKTVGATFTLEHTLTTTAPTNGTITGLAPGGKYLTGLTATLTAVPNPGYLFTSWTGSASGTANPLSIQMDSDKMIGATFEPDSGDADGDRLSAYLERAVYGTNPNLADTDGDGLTDAWEVGLGRFSIIQGTFTWEQARSDAKAKGSDLASFPDENRWNRAMETLGANALDPYTGLWIGAGDATEEGKWTWVNGEAFVY
jgi:uncharacterized repeat protein (TIGR02543 family)